MKVAYHSRNEVSGVDYPYFSTAKDLAAAVDVLALCCPGGAATRNLVDVEVLEALGPSGFLVNVARGSVVDEPALIKALQDGRIAGAALDVFCGRAQCSRSAEGNGQCHAATAPGERYQ